MGSDSEVSEFREFWDRSGSGGLLLCIESQHYVRYVPDGWRFDKRLVKARRSLRKAEAKLTQQLERARRKN